MGGHLVYNSIKIRYHLVLMVFPEMIYSCINHNFSQPAFKRTNYITICRLVMMNFSEDFQEPVVYNFNSILLVISIPVTNCHSITVERAVNFFLALSAVQGTSPDM